MISKGVNKIILGFVGPIASGKGTICRYLKENHQASVFRFSTMLRDVLNRLYLEQSRNNMQDLSLVLRQAFGDDLLASVIANDVKNDKAQIIAIDGVRREPDIKYLKELPGFHLIEINADQKIRWERITKRGENADDTNKTLAQLQQDELKEAEQQIKEVAKLANFKINNDGNLENLHSQIDDILQEIKKLRN